MKSIVAKGTILAGAILLCAAGTARADSDAIAEATVPFPFVVNGQTLPAGKYVIQRDETSPSVMMIRQENGNHEAVFVTTIGDGGHDPAGSHAVLTFKRVENQYRLESVWDSPDEGFDIVGR
jgi:hypothetical protein